jgi:NAD(P)H-hydrate epimerase
MEYKFSPEKIPAISQKQMIEVDRLMVEVYNIQLIQMMENAGRNLARLAVNRFLNNQHLPSNIVILSGTGGNGGGVLVCARHLHNLFNDVTVVLTKEYSAYKSTTHQQLNILKNMGVKIIRSDKLIYKSSVDLIIDGIFGYNLSGNPHGEAKILIMWANGQKAPILSLDVPSGLELSTGNICDPVIKATATLTLALPKLGLQKRDYKSIIGELYLVNIGVPPELYKRLNPPIEVKNIFESADIIQIS